MNGRDKRRRAISRRGDAETGRRGAKALHEARQLLLAETSRAGVLCPVRNQHIDYSVCVTQQNRTQGGCFGCAHHTK